jgi:hypothetical protein
MRRILILSAVAAVALLGTSCNPNAGDISPLSVGSVWNMEMLLLSGTTLASLDTAQTGTGVNTAVEKTTLSNGKEVIKFKSESTTIIHRPDPLSDTTITTTNISYYREEGDWILGYSALDDTTGDTMMVSTPTVGKTWSQSAYATATVVGQEDVTVKAGTYKNAWKVKLVSTAGGYITEIYSWYAKGTGMVKMHYEFAMGGYTQVYNQELTSATVK